MVSASSHFGLGPSAAFGYWSTGSTVIRWWPRPPSTSTCISCRCPPSRWTRCADRWWSSGCVVTGYHWSVELWLNQVEPFQFNLSIPVIKVIWDSWSWKVVGDLGCHSVQRALEKTWIILNLDIITRGTGLSRGWKMVPIAQHFNYDQSGSISGSKTCCI